MENIPQPSDTPYEPGDVVRIYLSDDDLDSHYHGFVCEIVDDDPDDLGGMTGREIDDHHYQLRRVETDEILPLRFRHSDLVPVEEWPKRD